MDPRKAEISVPGTVMYTLFRKFTESPESPRYAPDQALMKLSRLNLVGSFHIVARLTSWKLLRPVIRSTYTGNR